MAGNLITEYYANYIEQHHTIRPHYLIQSKKEIEPGQFEISVRGKKKKIYFFFYPGQDSQPMWGRAATIDGRFLT